MAPGYRCRRGKGGPHHGPCGSPFRTGRRACAGRRIDGPGLAERAARRERIFGAGRPGPIARFARI
jgi:hypothetical protein